MTMLKVCFLGFRRMIPVVFVSLLFLVMGSQAFAEETKGFNVKLALQDNLKIHAGKMVAVSLKSGEKLSGIVKSVGKHFLLLSELSGKEFYDALIRIDDISAVEKRVRDR